MEELLFFGVIIILSILDSVIRKKKQGEQGLDGLPVPPPQGDWESEGSEVGVVPTYRSDRTDDDGHRSEVAVVPSPRAARPPAGQSAIPKDVWEEIAAMAGMSLPEPVPEPVVERPQPVVTVPVVRSRTRPARTEEHSIHQAHAGYGTDPSERAASEQDGLDPLAQHLSKDAAAARALLASHDPHSLRQAVILQELLGLPAAYRE